MHHPARFKRQVWRRENCTTCLVPWTAVARNGFREARLAMHGGGSVVAGCLSRRELVRKLWHMTPGALILGLPLVRGYWPFNRHLTGITVATTLLLTVVSLVQAQYFTRHKESDWAGSVWAYAVTALLPLAAAPEHIEIALGSLVILAFGDGAATLGGLGLSSPPLPWNQHKSWAGLVTFFLCAAPCATWIYWGAGDPRAALLPALVGGVCAAAVAAVAESLPSSINDNLRVGMSAASILLWNSWINS